MATHLRAVLVLMTWWLTGAAWGADDAAEVVQKQREAAKANWKRIFDAPPEIYAETTHLLLYATQGRTVVQLRHVGRFLESELPLTRKAIGIETGDELWPGKLAVYLFDQPRELRTLVLTAGKKRPEPGQLGTFSVRGKTPYVGAAPDNEGNGPGAQERAGQLLAEAILTSKGGDLPGWVIAGFGRATVWRANPNGKATRDQRSRARKAAARVTGMDVWTGNVDPDDAAALRGSLVDFLAYGPGAKAFPKFLEGFKPGEGGGKKTEADAFKAAHWEPERISYAWR